MKYATTVNNTITQFPITEREWQRSGVSIRKWADCTDAELRPHGIVRVYEGSRPETNDRTHRARLDTVPALNGARWEQQWIVTENTVTEIHQYDNDIRRRISEEAERRTEALIPQREQMQRLAKQVLLQDKGKPNWTAEEQAFRDENLAKWVAVQAVLDKEAALLALDPPPEDYADDRHWS